MDQQENNEPSGLKPIKTQHKLDFVYEDQQKQRFEINKNFSIVEGYWGNTLLIDLSRVLDNIVSKFYETLISELLPVKEVVIQNIKYLPNHTPGPEIVVKDYIDKIYLDLEDNLWCQYIYQFSHELCHHVIGSDAKLVFKFKWFEETLCELASLYCLEKLSISWKTDAPYPNWSNYASVIKSYKMQHVSKPENIIEIPFENWFAQNIDEFYSNRYRRTENRIVALQLFDLFNNNPFNWQIVQYLSYLKTSDEMDFKDFLLCWEAVLPEKLKVDFRKITLILNV